MDRIIKHIERLLLQHDCVIIPEFGGFVLQSATAVYLGNEHSFTPARKEIVFNPTLTHNDGLLVESYMQEYYMDFDKAQQLVRKDVASMKSTFDDSSELQLGKIGFFVKEDDRLLFMPAKSSDVLFSTRSYGLPIFHYLPLSARIPLMTTQAVVTSNCDTGTQEAKTENRSKNIIYYIPVTRTFFRIIAVAAAAILLFLFISTPVSDVNNAAYTASFVPQEIMPKKTVNDIVSDAFSATDNISSTTSNETGAITREVEVHKVEPVEDKIVSEKTEPAKATSTTASNSVKSTSSKTATTKSSISTTSKSSASKSTSAKTSSASNTEGAKYYVIIGSFKSKTHAQTFIKELKGSQVASTAKILVRDGRARIYAGSFSNENDAQEYMNKLHQNTKHKQAWVYFDK